MLTAVYLTAVMGDVLLAWRQQTVDEDIAAQYAEASAIEATRFREQDIPEIQAAVADGYAQSLYLSSFDTSARHRALAEKYGIAPLAPQPRSSLLYCNEGYGLVRYVSDRYGFRNSDATWDHEQLDAVLVGDSFVHGACVGDDQTISGHLARAGLTVLNLGTGGNGPIQYAALAKTFVPRTSPRFVFVFFHPNDNLDETGSVYRSVFFGTSAAQYFDGPDDAHARPISKALGALYAEASEMLRYPSPGAELKPAPLVTRESVDEPFLARVGRSLRLTHLRAAFTAISSGERLETNLPWSTRLAVDTTLAVCPKPSCTAAFVFVTNSDYWSPDHRADAYKRSLRHYVQSRAGASSFLDTSEGIKELGRSGFAPAGKHYSPDGYARVAGQVQQMIESAGSARLNSLDKN